MAYKLPYSKDNKIASTRMVNSRNARSKTEPFVGNEGLRADCPDRCVNTNLSLIKVPSGGPTTGKAVGYKQVTLLQIPHIPMVI